MEHMQDLKDHPDVTSMEAVVEHVPPFVGKAIPSIQPLSLVNHALDSWKAYSRALEIPFVTGASTGVAKKGLSGLSGLTSNKRKKSADESRQAVLSVNEGLTLKTADAILILRHHLNNNN